MAATTGTMYFVGASSRNYAVSIYVPDAVSTTVLFAPTGTAGTGSAAYWRAPEDVVLKDVLILAAPTATVLNCTADGAAFNGNVVLYGAILYSAVNRTVPGWKFRAGSLIGATNS